METLNRTEKCRKQGREGRGWQDWRASLQHSTSHAFLSPLSGLFTPWWCHFCSGDHRQHRESCSHCTVLALPPANHLAPLLQLTAKPKAAQGYVTDYTREIKGKERKESSKQEIQQISLSNRNARVTNVSSAQLQPQVERRGRRRLCWQGPHAHPSSALISPARGSFPFVALGCSAKQTLLPFAYTKKAGPHEKHTELGSNTGVIQCKRDGESTPQQ